jgi:hypothetical protein
MCDVKVEMHISLQFKHTGCTFPSVDELLSEVNMQCEK